MIAGAGMGGGPQGMLRSMGGGEQEKVSGRTILRLLAFVRPHWKLVSVAAALMVIASGTDLLVPFLTKTIIDSDIVGRNLSSLLHHGALLAAAMVVSFVASSQESYILSRVGQLVLNTLRNRLFEHLQRLSVAYNDTNIVGVTISRVISDVSVINNLLTQGLLNMVADVITIVGTVAVMMAMDARLALLSFSVIPLMLVSTVIFTRHARIAYLNTREKIGVVIGDLSENIGGMREIQAFRQEGETQRRFDRSNRENRDANVDAMTLSFIFIPTVDLLSIVATCIVLVAGGLMIAEGNLTIGVMVAFMTYVTRFFMPIRDLSQLNNTLQTASAGGARVLELLAKKPAVSDYPGAADVREVRGHVKFDHVSFSYVPGREVLHDISFEVRPGSMIALVGPTGAGKTSISNLLCRFYEVGRGAVLVDGRDIRDMTQASLHRHIGYVPQSPFVFSASIADNIRFGRPGASDEEVRSAARLAEASTFIERLPEDYDTVIAEGGANLSTGQRQLVCIARAVLVDPRIIIMDEATSSVDTVTERLIQQALERLMTGRTSVVIAHRLSTIRNADCIHVIDEGRIVASGTHDELVERGGLYRTLYEQQFISTEELT